MLMLASGAVENLLPPRAAWVTLLAGNSENLTTAAVQQALSVARYSAHPHLTLATRGLAPSARARLEAARSTVLEVREVAPRAPRVASGGPHQALSEIAGGGGASLAVPPAEAHRTL